VSEGHYVCGGCGAPFTYGDVVLLYRQHDTRPTETCWNCQGTREDEPILGGLYLPYDILDPDEALRAKILESMRRMDGLRVVLSSVARAGECASA
jgi:hypothetical protein